MAFWLQDSAVKSRSLPPVGVSKIPWVIRGTLLVFIGLIPLESLGRDDTTSSFTITRIAGIFLLASCALRPKLVLRRPELVTILSFSLMTIALLRTLFIESGVFEYALARYVTWVQMLVFYHIATPVLAETANRILAIYAYIMGACVTSIFLLVGVGLSEVMLEKDRASLGNMDPNFQSAVLGLAAVWLIVALVNNRNPIRKPWFLLGLPLFAIFVAAILLTGSRGGLIALMAALILVLVTRSALSNPASKVLLLGIVALVVGVIAFHDEGIVSRVQNTIFEGDTAGRDYIFSSSFDLWMRSPWLGWGLGSIESALGGYVNKLFRDMHNIYFYTLTAAGVLGVCLLAGMLFLSIRTAVKLSDSLLRQVALIGLFFVLVTGCAITILFLKFFWLVLVISTPVLLRKERSVGYLKTAPQQESL